MTPNLQGFPDLDVVCEFLLFLSLHGFDDFEVVLVESVGARFVVLRDAGVVEDLFFDVVAVVVPSGFERARGLAEVDSVGGTGACVFVDSFFLYWVRVGAISAAKHVLEFGCRSECSVDACLSERPSKLV